MNIPQVKARGILLWWGKFRFMYNHAVFYVGAVQLVLVAAVAYNTTVAPWMTQYFGWSLSFWQYCLALAGLLLVGMVLEFMFGVPAVLAVANEQVYKHENPIKTNFDAVLAKQLELEGKINKIMKHLNIEDTE
jgi:hypothetical protein